MNAIVRSSPMPEDAKGVTARGFCLTERTVVPVSLDTLDRWRAAPGVFVWIDVEAPTVDALNNLLPALGLDLVLGRHIDDPALLPRIVEHAECLACYVYEVADPDRHLHIANGLGQMTSTRCILVLGDDFVVTFHRKHLPCIDYVEARSEAVFRFEGSGPSLIAYLLFQRCLYEYAHLNLANDNYLDALQAGLRADDYDELASLIELAHANILTLKKMVASLQIVLGRLTTMATPYVDEEFRTRVLQLHKNAFPVRWSLDSSRQFLDGIIGGMQTAASNRMSEIATVLTIVSTIILPLTLITGVYGMNFDIPEVHMHWGYFICLAIMTGIVVCQIYLFHRLGWLRGITRALRQLATSPARRASDPSDAAALGDPADRLSTASAARHER